MLRDILELRKSKWVPRRQKDEAKKISEIHAAAHAELGMIPAAMMPGLAPLPVQARAGVPGMGQDVELFPAFKTDGAPPRSILAPLSLLCILNTVRYLLYLDSQQICDLQGDSRNHCKIAYDDLD